MLANPDDVLDALPLPSKLGAGQQATGIAPARGLGIELIGQGVELAPRPGADTLEPADIEAALAHESGRIALVLSPGAGIYGHLSPVSGIPNTSLALAESGFMRLDIARDGRVRLGVITVDRVGNPTEVYSTWMDTARTGVATPRNP